MIPSRRPIATHANASLPPLDGMPPAPIAYYTAFVAAAAIAPTKLARRRIYAACRLLDFRHVSAARHAAFFIFPMPGHAFAFV